MSKIAHFSAQMLRVGRIKIAEAICDQQLLSSQKKDESRTETHAKILEQAEDHIHVLAACIEFSSPVLLEDYVHWISHLPSKVSPYVGNIQKFFEQLAFFISEHFPTEISEHVNGYIQDALEAIKSKNRISDASNVSPPDNELQLRYLESLLAKDRNGALQVVLEAVQSAETFESIYLDVIQPTQIEIGRLWQTGEISVAQEHYCTAATQFVISQLQPYFMHSSSEAKTLVAACVGDELHEVGLRIVADLFEIQGWNTIYIGANSPASSVADTLASCGAHLLALSTTLTQHLFNLAEVIKAVRSHPGCEHVKIIVGGYPFNTDPFLWKRIGADADASDGKEATSIAERLLQKALISENASTQTTHSVSDQPTERNSKISYETNEDLSRLNNSLITLQRRLTKANVQLEALNKSNAEKTEDLLRASRRKDEFLAMLAHELRGPLAPMELAVSLLLMDDLEPAMAQEACLTMKRQLQQMKHLINDLLDTSRIVHGKIKLQSASIKLNDVIHRAVEIVHPLIDEKDQTLELILCEKELIVHGDEIRLTQVISNLLTNACKYTNKKGQIFLKTRLDRDFATVEVRDNGVGIEAELLPDVFSTFSQEERSKQHSMGGLGLGLSLVKQLVELHGGSVKAESGGADKGSTFSISLPVLEPLPKHPSHEVGEVEDSAEIIMPSRKVLIVEDMAGIARVTSLLIEKLGHVAETALNGRSAIKKYEQSQHCIVILDLELPDMSGLEVAQEIHKQDHDNRTLIVALTGHSDEEHQRLAMASGCDEYLVKPVDIRKLQMLGTHPKLMSSNGSS